MRIKGSGSIIGFDRKRMFVKEQAQREQECNITSVKLLLNS